MVNILYAHFGENWLRGSEHCLLNLLAQLDNQQFTAVVCSNSSALCQQTKAMGITTYEQHFALLGYGYQDSASLLKWGKLVVSAVRLIRKQAINLIHVNSAGPCQWLVFAAKLCRVPVVTQIHSPYILSERFYSCCYGSSKIIAVSHAVSHDILADGYPSEQLSVVYNGIAPLPTSLKSRYWVREQLDIAPKTRLFVTVGSLIHRKGVDRLLNTLAKLEHSGANAHLLIIGDGPIKNALQTLAKDLGIAHRVTWAGEQRNVYQWLTGGIDSFVSGAREEAFGLVIAEAALAKLPIIAPNIGGIPEFVAHQHSALLYDDDHQLLQSWSTLITDYDQIASQLVANAHQTIAGTLTLDNHTQQMEAQYHQVLQQPDHYQAKLYRCLLPLKTFLTKRLPLGARHA